ncbi:oxygenase MpaB family protein [Polynucleobacter brandtiae]|uniref:Uncharacterized protein (DUF2236 family) n=1 Tax=Polynucleobacter brandtiae TaxID=1938816 RepID=A0A2M8VZQ1_9BURK|nr:oxygenase MpaB family protein [Polynucleobacter brandtiae]PJI83336.1 uncharacterized protein (DUF2236 family) [Polynucleobacter brandtiae]
MIEESIRKAIREMVGGSKGPPVAFLEPAGDRGLFGPESMSWEIHADFMSMMIGGISSLILQALHPGALGGVWDHSTFREDLKGRLGRTAFFIAATTYGPVSMAESIIAKVNQIHQKVQGIDEYGKPYSATDPHLLAWVHSTETSSFLSSYLTHKNRNISIRQEDQYFDEMTLLAAKLGTPGLPKTKIETLHLIRQYKSELHYGERAKSIVQLLDHFPASLPTKPFVKLITEAGFANLPDWAFAFIERKKPSALQRVAINTAVAMIAKPVRMALKDGVAAHSHRRIDGKG